MVNLFEFDAYPDLYKPKRFMRYVLVWCTEGVATVVVDEKVMTLKAYDVLTITSGQVFYHKKDTQAKGIVLEFSYGFFCKDDKDIELVFQNGLFCHFDMNEVISIDNQEVINTHLKLIQEELYEQPYQYLTSIHSRIELILVEINRAKIKRGDEIWKPDALYLKFLDTVRSNFEHNYPLSILAEKLNTTELKLNEQSKLFTGKTAQMVIYGLIVSEAKRLLLYDSLSIKEVAFKLGFNDPFYFSNFFKKHTQQSPKAYKEQIAPFGG
jgi:AraC family transcriptional regulator, transcriptional activator of pobA